MRQVGIILAYLVWVFVGAALLAPWLHWAVHHFAPESGLMRHPFHRYVTRGMLILALGGLWPLKRALGITWADTGLGGGKPMMRPFLRGLALGAGSLIVVAALAVAFGQRSLNLEHSSAEWLKHLRNACLAALVVSLMEELLFRGFLFGSLRRSQSFWLAAGVSASLYALLHFFERPVNPTVITWSSGFLILGRMMRGFLDLQAFLPGFLNLTLIGVLLAWSLEKSRTLFYPYGLHAGFILCAKSFPFITKARPGANLWVWGSDKLVDGWMTLAVLILLAMGMNRLFKGSRSAPAPAPA